MSSFQNDGLTDSNNVEVRLDDECAKVFAMDNDGMQRFDVDKLHDDTANSSQPKQYGEKDYSCKYYTLYTSVP